MVSLSAPLVAASVAWIYRRTLFRSIPGGDSGELLAEACKLGHAHPPGYPLFTMLYHVAVENLDWSWFLDLDNLFSDVERGAKDKALKGNAFSALLGTLAATILAITVERACSVRFEKGLSFLSGIVAGTGFALSELVWQYSIGTEVFALNNLLVSTILYLNVEYWLAKTPWYQNLSLFAGALVCGLALCNQHTAVLFQVPLICMILRREWRDARLTLSKLVILGLCFLVGLLPYAYLPVALRLNRQQGSWGDTTSVNGFIHHLRRGDYGTFRLYSRDAADSLGMMGRIGLYMENLALRQGMGFIPLLCLVGLVATVGKFCKSRETTHLGVKKKKANKRSKFANKQPQERPSDGAGEESVEEKCADDQLRDVGVSLTSALAFYVIVFHFLSNMPLDEELLYGVQARFWMQPNMIVFLFAGIGASVVGSFVAVKGRSKVLGWVVLLVCAAVTCVGQVWVNFEKMDQSRNEYMERYARSLLTNIPPKSLLVVGYDQQWTSLRYLQQCLGFREDVTILDGPMVTYAWFRNYRETYHVDQNKCVRFPGTHWAGFNSTEYNAGAFSTKELFETNLQSCPGGVYFSGSLPYFTAEQAIFKQHFVTMGVGLVKRVLPRPKDFDSLDGVDIDDGIKVVGFDNWLKSVLISWGRVDSAIESFPSEQKYDAETWEWTVPRDYYDHLCSDAANILSYAVANDSLELMAFAAFLLEQAFEMNGKYMSAANMKNLGLAFIRLVQSKKTQFVVPKLLEPVGYLNKLFGDSLKDKDWKNVAASRGFNYWSKFLTMKDADKDASYTAIKTVVQELEKTMNAK